MCGSSSREFNDYSSSYVKRVEDINQNGWSVTAIIVIKYQEHKKIIEK